MHAPSQGLCRTGYKLGYWTRVNVPGTGLQCHCYQDMPRADVIPASLPYTMETKAGGHRYTCTCFSPTRAFTGTPADMAVLVASEGFRQAAADALAVDLGVAKAKSMVFTTEERQQRSVTFPVLGIGAVVLGGAVLYYLVKKGKAL